MRKRKVWAEIDLAALKNNYNIINENLSANVRQICVVKADAYGNGAKECVKALCSCGADFFAVSCIDEALEVRSVCDSDILILGYTCPEDVGLLIENNIIQAIFSNEYAIALESEISALDISERLRVHIKLDTGMNRLGFHTEDLSQILNICSSNAFCVEGMFSHFAESDEPSRPETNIQYGNFTNMKKALLENGIKLKICHIANSAATFNFPQMQLDAVRNGISLYGINPSDETVISGLIPVMTLKTIVAHIHTIKAGGAVSYGGEYIADSERVIATIPIGYADGFIRAYKNGYVTINSKRAKIVGRICMDQTMVDITGIENISVGDEVVVFGEGGASIYDFAAMAGTIPYETSCSISKRVPRIYIE